MEPDERVSEVVPSRPPGGRTGLRVGIRLPEDDLDELPDPLEPATPTVALIRQSRTLGGLHGSLGGLDGPSCGIDRVLARPRGLSRVPDGPERRQGGDGADDDLNPLHGPDDRARSVNRRADR